MTAVAATPVLCARRAGVRSRRRGAVPRQAAGGLLEMPARARQHPAIQTLLTLVAVGILASPYIEGAVRLTLTGFTTLLTCISLVSVSLMFAPSARLRRLAPRLLLVLAVPHLALTLADLGIRYSGAGAVTSSTRLALVEPWPALAALPRYSPAAAYDRDTYGDLAARSANPTARELRQVRFEVDAL